MIRIEDTELNFSALIILCSNLNKMKTEDKYEPIIKDNKLYIVEKTSNEEKVEKFDLDTKPLEKFFLKFDTGFYNPQVLVGEEEQYLKKCSFAAYYFHNKDETIRKFDPFNTFHEIHFKDVSELNNEEVLIKQFC